NSPAAAPGGDALAIRGHGEGVNESFVTEADGSKADEGAVGQRVAITVGEGRGILSWLGSDADPRRRGGQRQQQPADQVTQDSPGESAHHHGPPGGRYSPLEGRGRAGESKIF